MRGGEHMQRFLLALGSGLVFYGFAFIAFNIKDVMGVEMPVTSPVTPPGTGTITPTVSVTATPTPTTGLTGTPSATLTPTPMVTLTPTPTVTPTPVEEEEEGRAHGLVTAQKDGNRFKLLFNAFGGDKVHGNVLYSDSEGMKFWGKADICYEQDGKAAAFAGTVQKGNAPNGHFLIEVLDQGKWWKNDSEDRLKITFTDSEPECNISGSFPAVVEKGNIRVR
jgi:hypothetical protein